MKNLRSVASVSLCTVMLFSTFVLAAPTTFSGQGTVVRVQLSGLTTIALSDTGALPPGGGELEATLLTYPASGLPDLLNGELQAQVLHAATVGQGQTSRAEASVADLSLTLYDNRIAVAFLMSRARAECHAGEASVSGSAEIVELFINGQTIAVSGAPNQTINLPNGKVVINEQQVFASGNFGDITTNALHITINGQLLSPPLANVVLSSAHADITCAEPSPPSRDFVTGGGWITETPMDAKGNFGVAGGVKPNGTLWGHLNYIDHGESLHVQGTGVMDYMTPAEDASLASTCRRIEGTAKINGQSGFTYEVTVCDHGEPGDADTFDLSLSNGYVASGNLQGGNIQLHD